MRRQFNACEELFIPPRAEARTHLFLQPRPLVRCLVNDRLTLPGLGVGSLSFYFKSSILNSVLGTGGL